MSKFDLDTLVEHLSTEDELALVIRAHLYVEAALVQLIESTLVNKQAIDVARL